MILLPATHFSGEVHASKIKLSDVAAISTADATSTASTETVNPTEFAAVVTLLNACKAKINAIIAGS